MTRKILAIALFIAIIAALLPQAALAAGTPPATISAPRNFAAANYGGHSFTCTLSAPDDLRALISQTQEQRGYYMGIQGQVDFKVDGGSWHYAPAWDAPTTYTDYALNYYNALIGGDSGIFLGHQGLYFKTMFPDDTNVPVSDAWHSWNWFKSHSVTLRARFAIKFDKNVVFSDWSPDYVLSAASVMDYKAILNNNAPTILSSTITPKGVDKVPWATLQLAQHPDPVQLFNAASSNSMRTEVWLRKLGDKDFKRVGDVAFSNEKVNLDVGAYFDKGQASYDAQAYEVKVRYVIDERAYQQTDSDAYKLLYSKFSNVFSYNMPAWSNASAWATSELQKADDAGLIPDILQGADMTKPITREEFAELAVLLYEKTTGESSAPFSPNPFTDTVNTQVLKAFALGITTGTSTTTFEPNLVINREQCATMLFRTIKAIKGDLNDASYPVSDVADFPDQKDIDTWAVIGTKYMFKLGIVKGDSAGNFMPKAATTAQQAVGYGTATREAAVLMSVRTYDNLK
jgi:hypothetical protein